MLRNQTQIDEFSEFMTANEPTLRRALSSAYGAEVGREATAEAVAYGWQHWDRVRAMANPAGYLFRVGQGKARRMRQRRPVPVEVSPGRAEVWFEPALAGALSKLSERQRVVVALIHGFDWSMSEVATFLGVSKASVQKYEARATKVLRRELGVNP